MKIKNFWHNIVWIWAAFVNVRHLLFKWVVFCSLCVAVYAAWYTNTLTFNGSLHVSARVQLFEPSQLIQPAGNASEPPVIDAVKAQPAAQAKPVAAVPPPQPAPAAAPTPPPSAAAPAAPPPASVAKPARPATKNTYAAGNCTWYAKSRRPDLPNTLGNANTWTARARAQGIPTGYEPRAGAIAQQGMHVVYVERVNSNGTMYISEMNYIGLGKTSERTVATRGFSFIY